jgi:tetratricopeptide (TPR) repeat protein
LIIVGGVSGWFIYRDIYFSSDSDNPETSVSPSPSSESAPEDFSEFMPDLNRQIVFSASVAESRKKEITENIDKVRAELKNDYDTLEKWLELGLQYKQAGDYEGAKDAWEFASLIRPKNSVSFHNLGDLYHLYLKDFQKSEENFLKAIENNPEQVFTYQNLYELYYYSYKEKAHLAEKTLVDGIAKNQLNPYLKVLLGKYYEEKGNKTGALKYYEEALRLDPKNDALRQSVENLK